MGGVSFLVFFLQKLDLFNQKISRQYDKYESTSSIYSAIPNDIFKYLCTGAHIMCEI